LGAHCLHAQFIEVARPDVDPRIIIYYSYELTSRGLNEEIRFKVKNNTASELRVTIKATTRYQCNMGQSFDVGINGVVRLEPNGFYNGQSDHVRSITQKSKDCYREVEKGRYTSFIGCDFWVKIEDLTSEKEAKETANKKREEERKKAAADAKAKAASAGNPTQKAENSTATPSRNAATTAKEDDFWETGKKSTPATGPAKATGGINGTGKPEFVKTTDGKYYQKDANNQMQEISYDRYMQIRHERSQAGSQKQEAKTVSKEEAEAAVNQIMEKVKKDLDEPFRVQNEIDRKFDQFAQNAANNRAVADSRERLEAAASLSGNYQSVAQLMAEFNQKMRQVNSAVDDLRVNKNNAWNSAVNSSFSGGSSTDAAIGETLKAVGGIVNAARAERERKEAREQLRLEKESAEKNLIAAEKRLYTGLRSDLFAKFPEGKLPLSSTKISANTVYFFVYAYNPAQIGIKECLLYVSNVFAVSRYSDGTWPFKTSFSGEIQNLTPFSEVMHGYYTNEKEAQSMRNGMLEIFQQSGGTVKEVAYKNKKVASSSASSNSSGDFWETGTKKTEPEKKAAKKDDFWEN
jgi:chemotaxis protein histidine kinase CheA